MDYLETAESALSADDDLSGAYLLLEAMDELRLERCGGYPSATKIIPGYFIVAHSDDCDEPVLHVYKNCALKRWFRKAKSAAKGEADALLNGFWEELINA